VAFFVWGATVAVFALINQYVSINSVDLSNHVKNAKLTLDVENLDTTAQQSGGWKAFIGGLKSGTLALEFEDDEAAGSVDATLWSALGTVVTFEVRADAGARVGHQPRVHRLDSRHRYRGRRQARRAGRQVGLLPDQRHGPPPDVVSRIEGRDELRRVAAHLRQPTAS
jgi:hypothetical protein